jgi:hypothetical protein
MRLTVTCERERKGSEGKQERKSVMSFVVKDASIHRRSGELEKRETRRRKRTHLFANINHLTPSHLLILLTIQSLITLLIMLDPLPKILLGLFRGLTVVVWISRSDFDSDVGGDHGGVGTDWFDEEEFETRFALDTVVEGLAAGAGRVGGVCDEIWEREGKGARGESVRTLRIVAGLRLRRRVWGRRPPDVRALPTHRESRHSHPPSTT